MNDEILFDELITKAAETLLRVQYQISIVVAKI